MLSLKSQLAPAIEAIASEVITWRRDIHQHLELSNREFRTAYERMLVDPHEPYLANIIVRPEENVSPMLPAGTSYKDITMSDEDPTQGSSTQKQGSNIRAGGSADWGTA